MSKNRKVSFTEIDNKKKSKKTPAETAPQHLTDIVSFLPPCPVGAGAENNY
jgi:hypothetical protein